MCSCNSSEVNKYTPVNNQCPSCNNCSPTKTNLAILGIGTQTVADREAFSLSGSSYQNGIKLTDANTVTFLKNGLYSIQFIVAVSATQPGPLSIGFNVNGGVFANGVINSTNTGLQLTGIGFVEIKNAPTIGKLINYSGKSIAVDFLRLTIIKVS